MSKNPARVVSGKKELFRQVTAMGTVGELGQLFTVYEKNWNCPDCEQENYASRNRCSRCKCSKPSGQSNYVMDPALQALQSGKEITWKEAIDPTSYQVYYYNTETGATQWERPEELGTAPMATGWFGRGAAGSNATTHYIDLNKKLLCRPAKKQKDFIDPKKYINETGSDYNIWYGRYLGDYGDNTVNKDPAADRCVLERDGGFTKADSITKESTSQRKDRRFFCLHFARGMCAKGNECIFYHRIPTQEDDARCDELFDCFGRSKHNKHRDDMNGVGSFMKPCRTLYVGNLLKQNYSSPKALEESLRKHFGEWGELENLNVIHRLSIAFPRFRFRTSAEFAKEAMSNQALDHKEILMIRWAYDDPNPVAQDAIARADKDAIASLLQSKGVSLEQAGFDYPLYYQLPAAKKLCLGNGVEDTAEDAATLIEHPEIAYPNTDYQYPSATSSSAPITTEEMTAEQYALYCQQYYSQWYQHAAAAAAGAGAGAGSSNNSTSEEITSEPVVSNQTITKTTEEMSNEEKGSEDKSESDDEDESEGEDEGESSSELWTEHVDPSTGATYYFNRITQESAWQRPENAV